MYRDGLYSSADALSSRVPIKHDAETGGRRILRALSLSSCSTSPYDLAVIALWEWLRRSRSLPKWVPKPRRLLRRSTCLHGWERALEMTRAREYPRATAPPRATAKCGAFSINAPTLRSGRKEASSRSCIAASYYAWDTIRLSGQLPIASVG